MSSGRAGNQSPAPPLIIPGASRVSTIRVLGVTISSDLGMGQHLDEVLATCASSMYALRVLRSHGLPPSAIHEVARMTTVSSLMYASPGWWGFTLAHDRARVEQLLRRMKRCCFLPLSAPTAEQLAASADAQLF